MERKIELFVNGDSSGNTIGQINLHTTEPISLTYSISDIKDISKTNSTFSKTFNVPADKNNNKLFNHIFNINSDSTFDPTKKVQSFLLVDTMPVFFGALQLTKIKVKNKVPVDYEVILYGETANLTKTIGDSYLTDLDFTELNHAFTVDNIMHSWSSSTQDLGYYYPLIDYGYDLNLEELNTGILSGTNYTAYTSSGGGLNPTIFQPALSAKYLWDKIFNEAGFSYESDFLRSEVFTELIIPYNGQFNNSLPDEYLETISFRVGLNANVNYPVTIAPQAKTAFNNETGADFYDNGGLFNTTTNKYTSNATTSQQFAVDLDFDYQSGSINGPGQYDAVTVWFFRSSIAGAGVGFGPYFNHAFETKSVYLPNNLSRKKFTVTSSPLKNTSSASNNYLYPATPGEEFWCYIAFTNYANKFPRLRKEGTAFYNIPLPNICVNGPLYYNSYIPKKVKQIDFVKSIITMFNLMVIPIKDNNKMLKIEPRQDYFNIGTVKNWTNKLDISEGFDEVLVSEQQSKQIILSYKKDSDLYNEDYFTKTNQRIYGEYIERIDNEWLENNSKQNIDVIFSPTPMENIIDTDEIVLPTIGKLSSNGNFGRTDFNIRILRKNPTLMPTRTVTIKMLGKDPQYSYPYAGHLNHPFYSTIDYNFGSLDFAYYNTPGFPRLQQITSNNLVQNYWREYLDSINDKNAKIITCKIHLTPADIAQFNYNDKIYIEGLTDEGGSYFIVNKLTYSPTNDSTSTVELIKLKTQ